ncbi:MAG: ferric reductase-like transmembrane domain-containing protein [Desulfatiglandales bacterium]
MAQARGYSPFRRVFLGVLFIVIGLILLGGVISIPFLYESFTIKYKFGQERIFLRTAKILGLIAGYLLLLQLVWSARLKILDRLFSLNRLLVLHRHLGVSIGALVMLHALLVLASEDWETLSFSITYWPELVGALLLLLILAVAVASRWRQALGLAFDRWWLLHRFGTALAVVALGTHVLFVSDTFEAGPPRNLMFGALGLYAVLYAWVKMKRLFLRRGCYVVEDISSVASGAYCLRIKPRTRRHLDYAPGQFAFLTLKSQYVSSEEHPFTLSSSPTRSENLQFTIHSSGDWTATVDRLRPGDLAYIDGPFGLFGERLSRGGKECIMLAGGIGITPMLSMLRYMADRGDKRKITLLWSNRRREHIVYADEFFDLEKKLTGLRVIHILTRDTEHQGETGRLDRPKLQRLLYGCDRKSTVFLCGPPLMMAQVRRSLTAIGFARRSIHTEEFRL